ncbi:MAG TPA: hypothetical protein VGR26_08750 [Acidimicrobiales bacterium]|nr:hypothetical protein [Acidimicrobiales bacterium]
MSNVLHSIVGSDWLWLPILAVSAMIVVAAMVVTGAAAAAALVVPYRTRAGRTRVGWGEVREQRRFTAPAREVGSASKDATVVPRSFGEAAWGELPLGTNAVEPRSA